MLKFLATPIPGLRVIESARFEDERGSFARAWCREAFAAEGIPDPVQANTSFNRSRGTLRGLHFQRPPSREGKLVRCTHGAIHDVAVDLRPGSPTFLRCFGLELSAANGRALYIPPGLAHGFMTLEPDSDVLYLMTDFHRPELADGVRWNDPAFGIRWPLPEPAVINPRDRDYPDIDPAAFDVFRDYWEAS